MILGPECATNDGTLCCVSAAFFVVALQPLTEIKIPGPRVAAGVAR